MASKRNKIEIIYDVLKSIRDKHNKIILTHILSKANLSYNKLKEYLDDLIEQKLIEEYEYKKQKYFKLTERGENYYEKLREMKKFMESFEI